MTTEERLEQIEAAFKGLPVGSQLDLDRAWRDRFLDRIVEEAKADDMTLGEFHAHIPNRVCTACLGRAWTGHNPQPGSQGRDEYWLERLVLKPHSPAQASLCPICNCTWETREGLWAFVADWPDPVCEDCVRDLSPELHSYLGQKPKKATLGL